MVLLVEDDPGDAELIALRLQAPSDTATSAPVRLLHADSVAAAQAALEAGAPDVIILDLSLPDARGLEGLHRMRLLAPGIPIVVLSGMADEAVALDALRAGAQDYVLKPPPDGSTLRRILRYARERQQLLMELDLASHASAAAAQRWRLLAEVGKALAASSDEALPLADVCRSLVPQGSDAAVIYFTDDDDEEVSTSLEVAHVEGRAAEARTRIGDLLGRPEGAVEKLLEALKTSDGLNQSELNDFSQLIAAELGMATSVAAPIRSGGNVRGFLLLAARPGRRDAATATLFAHSVADRIGLELDRFHLLRQTRQAVAARDRTFNIVSHDLGDPLSTIQICATALLDPDPPAFAGMRDMAQIIQRSASLMQQIVGDLLDRASLDSGRLALEREPTPVAEVVALMQAMFGRVTEERAVQFVVNTVPDLPEIDVDPRRIEQVLSNLLRNAVKFTPPGGRVVLSALPENDEPYGDVRFAVSDNGPGIPPEDLSHIFDWFWGSRERGRSGTGLGLAIAKGLIETHGGQLKVESIPGKGATFSFTMPRINSGGL
ncbi:MAG TPA: hybrid sensor histidine kinase/response regulator [Gemmatimonadales bacterium]|nr:hybrid sensor histidine kinase/response regulator [Gemmatimonadales bacterium]